MLGTVLRMREHPAPCGECGGGDAAPRSVLGCLQEHSVVCALGQALQSDPRVLCIHNQLLAASIGGFVGQDIVLDLCSGRLPGDQGTLSGDLTGCQVCRRVQDYKEEKTPEMPAPSSVPCLSSGILSLCLLTRSVHMLTPLLAWTEQKGCFCVRRSFFSVRIIPAAIPPFPHLGLWV